MANPLLLPQIAALLGHPDIQAQLGGAAPSPVPGAAPSPMAPQAASAPADAGGGDITVSGTPFAPSQYKDRQGLLANILPNTFRTGSTGGNILGAFKDAFLTQAGRNPIYAPKLQQMREAEALENYSTDPLAALQKLTMVDPGSAMKGFDTYYDNQRNDKLLDMKGKAFANDNTDRIRGLATSYLYGANEKTFPSILARVKDMASRAGVDPEDLGLPSTFDDAKTWALSSVPVQSQVQAQDMRDYRDATIANRQQNTANRDYYNRGRLAQMSSDSEWKKAQGQQRADAASSSAATRATMAGKAPDRSKWTQPQGRGGGSVAPGAARTFKFNPATGKYEPS